MACAFTHDMFEMIAMIVEVRTACWLSDQAAARKLETPTARHWYGHRSLRSSKRGGRGSFTMLPRHYEPTGAPSHALWSNGTLQPAYRRRSHKVGPSQAVQAFSASSEPFCPSIVCILGPLSRAASAHGPYLEHVVRAGSTLAAAQRSRPCSTILACNA